MTHTVIVTDRHPECHDMPLIYEVEITDPDNHQEILEAATKARIDESGFDESEMEINVEFLIEGKIEVIHDNRHPA